MLNPKQYLEGRIKLDSSFVVPGMSPEPYVDAACLDYSYPIGNATGLLKWKDLDSSVYPYDEKADLFFPIANAPPYQNVSGQAWGSGTLIGPNLYLTAGHCVQTQNPSEPVGSKWVTPFAPGESTQLEPREMVKLMSVTFNYQHCECYVDSDRDALYQDTGKFSFSVDKLLECGFEGKNGLDYAILVLKPDKDGRDAGAVFGFATICMNRVFCATSLWLFQHPEGKPKKVDHGACLSIDSTYISHNINTDGGSSGAGLTADGKSVCGVHVAYYGDHNKAVRMSAIYGVSPTIRQICSMQRSAGASRVASQQAGRASPNQTASNRPNTTVQASRTKTGLSLEDKLVYGGLAAIGVAALGCLIFSATRADTSDKASTRRTRK